MVKTLSKVTSNFSHQKLAIVILGTFSAAQFILINDEPFIQVLDSHNRVWESSTWMQETSFRKKNKTSKVGNLLSRNFVLNMWYAKHLLLAFFHKTIQPFEQLSFIFKFDTQVGTPRVKHILLDCANSIRFTWNLLNLIFEKQKWNLFLKNLNFLWKNVKKKCKHVFKKMYKNEKNIFFHNFLLKQID